MLLTKFKYLYSYIDKIQIINNYLHSILKNKHLIVITYFAVHPILK